MTDTNRQEESAAHAPSTVSQAAVIQDTTDWRAPADYQQRMTLERLIAGQCDAWRRGERLTIEELIGQQGLDPNSPLVADIVYNEILLRQELGETPRIDEYIDRFPALATELGELQAADAFLESAIGEAKSLPEDTSLFDRYEILGELARGGMGVVYKARQVGLDRVVALKMIRSGDRAEPADIDRFQIEAQAAAQLQHPHIVAVYDVGLHDSQPFFTMELVDGTSLATLLQESPPTARQAAEIMRTVARAIEFAHEHQVLHRDIKPSNILIDSGGNPRVTDFGLAKRIADESDLTVTGQILGTPSYMAPEQAVAAHGVIGPAADVYGLGATLYCVLTGRPPFRGETALQTLKLVLEADAVSPRLLNPLVPVDLETICLKCLQKKPESRYASANELADDLDRFLDGRPIVARPVPFWIRAVKLIKRRPTISALVGVATTALLALLAVGGFAVWQNVELRESVSREQKSATDAVQQSGRAEQNLLTAVDAVQKMLADVAASRLKYVPQAEGVRRDLAVKAEELLSALWEQQSTSPELQFHLAVGFSQFGDVQSDLAQFQSAITAFDRAITILSQLPHEQRQDWRNRYALARCYLGRSQAETGFGEHYASLASSKEAIRILAELRRQDSADVALLISLIDAYTDRVDPQLQALDLASAESDVATALELATKGLEVHPNDSWLQNRLARSLYWLACVHRNGRQLEKARAEFSHAVSIQRQLLSAETASTDLKTGLIASLNGLGGVLEGLNQSAEAVPVFGETEPLLIGLTRDFAQVPDWHSQLGEVYKRWARAEAKLGHADRTRELLRSSQHCLQTALSMDGGTKSAKRMTSLLMDASKIYRSLGDNEAAAEAAEQMPAFRKRDIDYLFAGLDMAGSIMAITEDAALPETRRAELAEKYSRRALAHLRVAMERHVHPKIAGITQLQLDGLCEYLEDIVERAESRTREATEGPSSFERWRRRLQSTGEAFIDGVRGPGRADESPPEPQQSEAEEPPSPD